MRIRVVVLPILFVALAAVPADAGLGGLMRGASKAASSSSRAASGASRAAASSSRAAAAATRAAPPVVAVPRGVPRAVNRIPPDGRRDAALLIAMRPMDEAPTVRAARFADDAAAEESVGMRAARSADEEAQAAQAAKDRRDLVKDILDSSKDAVEAVLDAQDATSGELDTNEVPALDYAEWVRHSQRLKRIAALAQAGEPDTAARLRAKEVRRHDAMLARLYNRVGSEP